MVGRKASSMDNGSWAQALRVFEPSVHKLYLLSYPDHPNGWPDYGPCNRPRTLEREHWPKNP